jgi:invasion protein IalB
MLNIRLNFFLTVLMVSSFGLSFAQSKEGQVYDNWTVGCETPEGAVEEQCFIFQNLVLREGRQRVLHIAVGYLPDGKGPVALVTLPLGISLPLGASITVNGSAPARFPIERCEPKGCRGGLKLDKDLLAALKKGVEARVTFHDSARQPVDVPVSLVGFAAGLSALRRSGDGSG